MKILTVAILACILGCSPKSDNKISCNDGGDADTDAGQQPSSDNSKVIDITSEICSLGSWDQLKPNKFPIKYIGGKVLTNPVNVYIIWYGSWDNDNTPTIIEDLISNFGKSSYHRTNTQYFQIGNGYDSPINPIDAGINDGGSVSSEDFVDDGGVRTKTSGIVNLTKTFHIGSPRGNSLFESDIIGIVNDTIIQSNGSLDPNGVYFVIGSKDVRESADPPNPKGFCSSYCGWHNQRTINNISVRYSFIGDPEQCPDSCSMKNSYIKNGFNNSPNNNWTADAMASVIVHELSETITDPDVNAWMDDFGYENGDKCAWYFGSLYKTEDGSVANTKIGNKDYLIQQNWTLFPDGGQGCALNQ